MMSYNGGGEDVGKARSDSDQMYSVIYFFAFLPVVF